MPSAWIEPETTRLRVHFDLPVAVAPAVKQALAVRVLDAVRRAGRTYGPVEVAVHAPGRTPLPDRQQDAHDQVDDIAQEEMP